MVNKEKDWGKGRWWGRRREVVVGGEEGGGVKTVEGDPAAVNSHGCTQVAMVMMMKNEKWKILKFYW